ncbi:PQQ-dependent sugar dehydrogenase [Nocardioides sp. W3-2-3]|uniref:PQQ-dependent sugar dehydrogenase n=1 Tax=Nocardioides convexus TaxID=2712224 RepID=UPI00241833EB|nr:PQQ-dependent sugar dehydrogenase [Nocardioides convexus]NGZ99478.1 PQQ-dependent sugar dehydrogenase [Nocardioides convexus]
MRVRLAALPVLALVASLLGAPGSGVAEPDAARAAVVPRLTVRVLASGLDHPWEVRALPSGYLLVTQRTRRALTLVGPGGAHRDIAFPRSQVWANGETGLLGLAVDPSFRSNRRIYTCSGWKVGTSHDIRVIAWRLDAKPAQGDVRPHAALGPALQQHRTPRRLPPPGPPVRRPGGRHG